MISEERIELLKKAIATNAVVNTEFFPSMPWERDLPKKRSSRIAAILLVFDDGTEVEISEEESLYLFSSRNGVIDYRGANTTDDPDYSD